MSTNRTSGTNGTEQRGVRDGESRVAESSQPTLEPSRPRSRLRRPGWNMKGRQMNIHGMMRNNLCIYIYTQDIPKIFSRYIYIYVYIYIHLLVCIPMIPWYYMSISTDIYHYHHDLNLYMILMGQLVISRWYDMRPISIYIYIYKRH